MKENKGKQTKVCTIRYKEWICVFCFYPTPSPDIYTYTHMVGEAGAEGSAAPNEKFRGLN